MPTLVPVLIVESAAGRLPVVKFGQSFAAMPPAVKEVECAILARKLRHAGHPILRWRFQNAVIDQDPAGNVKFNRARSAEKSDGAVAARMAVARAAANESAPSLYEERGFLWA